MKAYAIVIRGNPTSENAYNTLQRSTKMKIDRFDAITPDDLQSNLQLFDLTWNYPWNKEENDILSGLRKIPYPTQNKNARIACAVSHYIVWEMISVVGEPVVVLEHDAMFTQELDINPYDYEYDILGINDPRGATRKSNLYHESIQKSIQAYQHTPMIDEPTIPQGLAGNSAYIMKPKGAKKMIDLVKRYGLWPNDALMCRQLIPNIGVSRRYYTKVQGTRSTTTL